MAADAGFTPDPGEPLGLWTRSLPCPTAPNGDLRALRFEFSSRGDRVPGRLWLPPAGGAAAPLVLLEHGMRGSKDAAYLDAAAGPWVRGGAAVASIDFPLHGQRADAKLAERMLRGLAPGAAAAGPLRALVVEFVRQAVIDLRRSVDALERLPEIDAGRIAYAGFSLGAIVGATFCGVDPRPRAAALALGGGGLVPAEADPTRFIGRLAPRPLLLVNAGRDATIPRAAAEALFAAAGEPKQILWFEAATHDALPGAALKAMWEFLRRHLGLDAAPLPGVQRDRGGSPAASPTRPARASRRS